MEIVSARGLWLAYPGGDWVLRGVTFSAGRGLTLLAGGTGSGKSSLLRVLAGVADRLYGARLRGEVTVPGSVLLIPQEADLFILFPKVGDELAYLEGLSGGSVTSRELAEMVGLRGREDTRVSRLSAGERQRLALASVFALRSSVVLLDEPLAYLDYWMSQRLLELLVNLSRERIVIVAEHRLWFFRRFQPRVLVIEGGRIAFDGVFHEACSKGFDRLDFGRRCRDQ